MRKLFHPVLLGLGWLFLLLALLGLALPLLPTTPFLLLATACFARSSPRCERWLLRHPWFGPPVQRFRAGEGIARRHKVVALGLLWPSIIYAAGWVVAPGWLSWALIAVALGVTVYLLRVKTYR